MKQFNVTGMSCAACSARVEKAVSKVPGVTSYSVSLLTNSMGVEGTAADSAIVAVSEDASFAGRVQVFSDDDLTDEPGFAAVETRRASRRPGWDFHRIRDQTSRLRLTDGRRDGFNECDSAARIAAPNGRHGYHVGWPGEPLVPPRRKPHMKTPPARMEREASSITINGWRRPSAASHRRRARLRCRARWR